LDLVQFFTRVKQLATASGLQADRINAFKKLRKLAVNINKTK